MSNQQHEPISKDLHMTYSLKDSDYRDSFKDSLDKYGLYITLLMQHKEYLKIGDDENE